MSEVTKIRKILLEHKDILKEMFKVKEIGIFGSYVGGNKKRQAMWTYL